MFNGVVRTLKDVRFVPGLKKNLVSLGQLDNFGLSYKAKGGILKVTKGSMVVIKANRNNGLYEMMDETYVGRGRQGSGLIAEKDNMDLRHCKLEHMSLKGLQVLSKQGILNGDEVTTIQQCESCIMGKQHRLSFKLGSHYSKSILEYIHADL